MSVTQSRNSDGHRLALLEMRPPFDKSLADGEFNRLKDLRSASVLRLTGRKTNERLVESVEKVRKTLFRPANESQRRENRMMKQLRKYSKDLAVALIGLLFIGTGLVLAALSNPARFSLDVQNDNTIDLYVVCGFLCTVVGVGLFVTAARQTTQSMPAVHRTNTNLGVGLGLVLQLAGLFLPFSLQIPGLAVLVLVIASLPPFVWGTMSFAQGKGYPRQFGLAGILGLVGLVCLMLLPDQNEETNSAG